MQPSQSQVQAAVTSEVGSVYVGEDWTHYSSNEAPITQPLSSISNHTEADAYQFGVCFFYPQSSRFI